MKDHHTSLSHAVFSVKLHVVFVTKYRHRTLNLELLEYLRAAFSDCLRAWRCELVEFRGEADHVELLIDIHPALDISVLVNNLKTASARRARARFAAHLARYYDKPLFWHRAYFLSSVGSTSREAVLAYVGSQGGGGNSRAGVAHGAFAPGGKAVAFGGGGIGALPWPHAQCGLS